MLRSGPSEAPSPQRRGWGETRSEALLYSCACGHMFSAQAVRVVDAVRDPALAERALAGTLHSLACTACGTSSLAELPFLYHDERQRVLVLVLPAWARARELEERAACCRELASGGEVPGYARDFRVCYGGDGLGKTLAAAGNAADRAAELEVREAGLREREEELTARAADLTREATDAAARIAELEQLSAALAERKRELDDREAELAARRRELEAQHPEPPAVASLVEKTMAQDTRPAALPMPTAARNPDDATNPFPRQGAEGPGVFGALGKVAGTDPFKTQTDPPRAADRTDELFDRWIESRADRMIAVQRGRVRMLAKVPSSELEALISGPLGVRILLHKLPTYPVTALAVGRFGEVGAAEPLLFPLDLQKLEDRQVLGSLATAFRTSFDLYDPDYLPVVHRELDEPLAANVRWVLTAAEAHLASIPAARRSYTAALAELLASGFDRFGSQPVALEEDSFALLPAAGATRVALGVIAHWSQKQNEEYLVAVRSFPLDWWRRMRARVVTRAVELGLALPPPLGDIALEAGLARSRRELLSRLTRAFADTVAAAPSGGRKVPGHPTDLDPDAIAGNWRSLVTECENEGVPLEGAAADLASAALGTPVAITGVTSGVLDRPDPARVSRPVTLQPRSSAFGPSESQSVGQVVAARAETSVPMRARPVTAPPVAAPATRPQAIPEAIVPGHSGEMTRPRPDLAKLEVNALLELLDDKDLRRDVALEVCRRKEPFGVGPVFGAVRRMTRGEAVRVLPAVVQFGDRAVPHLVDGLRSRKAYLRQGCALALGVLKSADGIDPLCDLLLGEPTDIWREIARAVGEIGPGAVMSLAARIRDPLVRGEGVTAEQRERVAPESRERIAWAMAHIAARGGRGPIDTLAGGRDPVASGVAKRAIELAIQARDNDDEVRGPSPPRDQTVNRAFSRRFFEAMNGVSSASGRRGALGDGTGTIPLDDSQIVSGDEEALGDEDILADH